MSKKTNTLLFILGGTLLNVLIIVIFIILFSILYQMFLSPVLPESINNWALPIIFMASIAVSFFVYRLVVKAISKKIDMEKNFDPLFGRHQPPRKPE